MVEQRPWTRDGSDRWRFRLSASEPTTSAWGCTRTRYLRSSTPPSRRASHFFDTSDSYGDSEERLAQALGRHRDEVVIATKFGSPVGKDGTGGAAPAYVREAVERSLRRLGTDRIDLYQLHRPDPQTPIADTLGVLDELVRQGKVREIGCSNFSAELLREADEAVPAESARFVSVQNHYNLLNREDEREVLPECRRLGLAYLPYFPLASGHADRQVHQGRGARLGNPYAAVGRTGPSGVLSDQQLRGRRRTAVRGRPRMITACSIWPSPG